MRRLKLGKYKHYKGNFYQVLGIARHSEDLTLEFVVYKPLYKSPVFKKDEYCIRPKAMFLEDVVIDGKRMPRFEYVKEVST